MPWTLVTPASRGIGFHLTRHLLRTTSLPILATARKDVKGVKSRILEGLEGVEGSGERLRVLEVDLLDEKSIARAAAQAKEQFGEKGNHLRTAYALPGVLYPEKSPQQLEQEQLTHTFALNTIAPLLIIKHFSPFLPTKASKLEEEEGVPGHAVWTTMSARVGSISDNSLGGWYSYRASKAAVNSLTKSFDLFLKTKSGDKAIAVAYHPGTVKTGLSKEFWGGVPEGKLFEPEFAVEKMAEVCRGRGVGDRGRCWDWKGEEILP